MKQLINFLFGRLIRLFTKKSALPKTISKHYEPSTLADIPNRHWKKLGHSNNRKRTPGRHIQYVTHIIDGKRRSTVIRHSA
jgi:hypothetical protein